MGVTAEVEEIVRGVPVYYSAIVTKTRKDDKRDVLINPTKIKITAWIAIIFIAQLANKSKPDPETLDNILENKANIKKILHIRHPPLS